MNGLFISVRRYKEHNLIINVGMTTDKTSSPVVYTNPFHTIKTHTINDWKVRKKEKRKFTLNINPNSFTFLLFSYILNNGKLVNWI